jgi:NTE family protein
VKALAEAGIAIDRVGGTSQGALIGATCAIGWDHEQMLEVFGRFRRDNPTNDLTVPTVSLIAGRKAERLLQAQFGERRIEDLLVDYFCISSSLTTGHVHIHRRGLLREALRASISIPGIFPPVARDGEFLVDGGVLDNLPIGPMRERGAIRVIAVNVTVARGVTPRAAEPKRGFFRRKPRGEEPRYRLPSIVQTLMSAGSLGTVAKLDALRHAADLFIEPPVDAFRTLDWDRIEEIVELGYRHARECLRRWEV